MSRERFTIRLNTDDPRHARVLKELHSIPTGRRGEYAVQLILQGLDLSQTVYQSVVRALSEHQPQQLNMAQSAEYVREESHDMLGFIFALQNEEMV